ncbi:hypothetical protein TNCV_5060501 [Trichonephila clavipes]|nr:hypothetical protein TNCV_5060501 [Trichonephila clavipes]
MVEEEVKRWADFDHLLQNLGGTEPNCTVICIMRKAKGNGRSFAMRERDDNRLMPGLDYMVDALKLPNQAPRASGKSLSCGLSLS